MKIHEFQAKELFRKYKVPVPEGSAAYSVEEAVEVSKRLEKYPQVVKAQIHAGGRGKGGGVKLVQSEDELKTVADEILGMTLVTHQTGPEGRLVKKLLVEAGQDIAEELYLSILVDRETGSFVIIGCKEGGMDIEEVAASTPEKIIKVYVDPLAGLQSYQLLELGFGLQLSGVAMKQLNILVKNLFTFFTENDCSLVEINPLIVTGDDQVIALDVTLRPPGHRSCKLHVIKGLESPTRPFRSERTPIGIAERNDDKRLVRKKDSSILLVIHRQKDRLDQAHKADTLSGLGSFVFSSTLSRSGVSL